MKLDNDLTLYHLNKSQLKTKISKPKGTETKEDKVAYNKKLKKACDGFEEIFVHKLITVMRNASDNKDTLINGGRGEEIFQDMLDEKYADLITKNGGVGLSNLIYQQTKKS